jgi:hypothetical protein
MRLTPGSPKLNRWTGEPIFPLTGLHSTTSTALLTVSIQVLISAAVFKLQMCPIGERNYALGDLESSCQRTPCERFRRQKSEVL